VAATFGRWTLRIAVFLLPLAFLPNIVDEFVLPKLLLARLFIAVSVVVLLTRWLRQGTVTWKRTALDLPLLAFIASAGLSTVFGVNRNVAIFGTYDRWEGLLTIAQSYDRVLWIDQVAREPECDCVAFAPAGDEDASSKQARAILDMQLRRLAALEREKLEQEYKQVTERIAFLEDLLAHPAKILALVKADLLALKDKYGDERRTAIVSAETQELRDEGGVVADVAGDVDPKVQRERASSGSGSPSMNARCHHSKQRSDQRRRRTLVRPERWPSTASRM